MRCAFYSLLLWNGVSVIALVAGHTWLLLMSASFGVPSRLMAVRSSSPNKCTTRSTPCHTSPAQVTHGPHESRHRCRDSIHQSESRSCTHLTAIEQLARALGRQVIPHGGLTSSLPTSPTSRRYTSYEMPSLQSIVMRLQTRPCAPAGRAPPARGGPAGRALLL
eukprot:1185696-Prorocentrum_minimum.AAC.1